MIPFKGLASFTDTELDAQLFFGRERDIQTIAANLIASRFTVLYGVSGVGKSSVLNAGVVRRIRELAPEALVVAYRDWAGGAPLRSLAAAIPGLQLGSGRSLADALAGLTESRSSELYLALDQLEDVFMHRGSDALVHALAEVVTRPGLRVHVLVSVREDALSELDVFTGLIPNVFGNYLPLDRLDRDSARDAIMGPLERMAELAPETSVDVDPALVEAVLDETGVGRVALGGVALGAVSSGDGDRIEAPYLQLVMQRLWEIERGRGSHLLRRSTLDELGGARGILRAHLERALAALERDERDAAARMFHHLVTPSGTKIVHRVADLADYADVPEDLAHRVLAKLAPPRIVRPLDGSAELYHDVLADAVLAWRTQHDAERKLEQQHAAAVARQRRLAVAVAVCLVALAAMTALTAYALTQRSEARGKARDARAKRLDAIASALIPVAPPHIDPGRGLELAARAARLAPDPPADDILRRALLVSYLRRVLPNDATATAYSPSAQRLAVATRSGTALVYAADLRAPIARLRVGAPIAGVALSGDGRRLVTVAERGPAIVWEVATGRRIATLGSATSASFSPDDRLIVTFGGREVSVWRATDGSALSMQRLPAHVAVTTFAGQENRVVVAAGRLVRTFAARGGPPLVTVDHGATVNAVETTQDGRLLITAGRARYIRLWDLSAHGRLVREFDGHRSSVTSLALLPNRPVLVSTSSGGSALVWDLRERRPLRELIGHTNRVTGTVIDDKGTFVLTWSTDATARIWNVETGKTVAVLAAGTEPVTAAAFGPNGIVVTTSRGGRVRLWRPQLTPRLRLLARVGAHARAAAFTRDGRRAAVAVSSAIVVVDDRGRRLTRLPAAAVRSVAISDDGRRIAYASGTHVAVRGLGRGIDDFTAPSPRAALAFSPDGRTLAVGTATGAIQLHRLDTRKTTILSSENGAVTSLAFSPAGDRLAAGHGRGSLTVWRTSRTAPVFTRTAHSRGTRVLGVAFSTSGRLLVTTGQDSDVRVWNSKDGLAVTALSGHFTTVTGVEFSPDGRWIVSAGPGAAGLWDVGARQRLLFLDGHEGQLLAATFDRAGRRIETVGVDGTIRTFDCAVCGGVPELLRLADARLAATDAR